MSNSLPQVFDFQKTTHYPLRSITQNDEHWFVAGDVCAVLDITNVSQSVENLDEDEKLLYPIHIAGQNRNVLLVSLPGLFKLTFRSNKPEAKEFTRWVTHTVLPAIMTTGTYSLPADALPQAEKEDVHTIILRYVERLHNPTARDLSRYITRYPISEIRLHLQQLTEQGKLEETFTGHSYRYSNK